MPPPKKAAAKHAHHNHSANKDRLRAYEHLGRVEVLSQTMGRVAAKQVDVLIELAKEQAEAGYPKNAADMLRAAEHLGFASLYKSKAEDIEPELEEELAKEFDARLKKANEHWSDKERHLEGVEEVFTHAKDHAQASFKAGAYRQALELARAAEALGHIEAYETEAEISGGAKPGEDHTER